MKHRSKFRNGENRYEVYFAYVREYATFWEGETSVADYFKVYKDKNKRAVTRGITAWIFVQKHFMPIFYRR